MSEVEISVYIGNEHRRSYIVDAVPQVGHMICLDREVNLIVTKVIWSINRKKSAGGGFGAHTEPLHSDLDLIEICGRIATKEEEEYSR